MVFVAILALILVFGILVDAFEAIILPRRATGDIRISRLLYLLTWPVWSLVPRRLGPSRARENFLSWYGPLSMILLLLIWAVGLIIGFGLLYWSLGAQLTTAQHETGLWIAVYMSGSTFFTLGLGDVIPHDSLTRALTVAEAGLGFGFLAIVIGYLPVLYGQFSKRETQITMLDGRAGSPPCAAEILARLGRVLALSRIHHTLATWEVTAAEMLESHISYPVLIYYRSQQENQSWLASLTAILDTCALVIAGIETVDPWQAQMTFAMARHTLVDLALIVHQEPVNPKLDRLPAPEYKALHDYLADAGVFCARTREAASRLAQLRTMYEPYVEALARCLVLEVPPWKSAAIRDNWKTSPFGRITGPSPSTRTHLVSEELLRQPPPGDASDN
jgi:hypothetical protein